MEHSINREKVISWLEGLAQQDWRMFHSDSEVQVIAEYALALLKEQQEIVRCKDCMYSFEDDESKRLECRFHSGYFPVTEDWFCANGEREHFA